jgi:hypothetical protein
MVVPSSIDNGVNLGTSVVVFDVKCAERSQFVVSYIHSIGNVSHLSPYENTVYEQKGTKRIP